MARNFFTPINLNGLELQAAAIGNLSTTSINAITSGTGRIQYDSTLNVLKYRDNTGWQTISTGGGSFTLGSTSISLGSTTTTIAGLSSVTSTTFVGALTGNADTATTASATTGTLTFGTGLTAGGSSFNGSTNVTITPVTASTSVAGIVQLSDSTSTTSSTVAATSTAAKAAYDRGSLGVTNAATAQSTADAALPKAGGTMTGFITTHADPTSDLHVANKRYVDTVSAGINVHEAVKYATTGALGTTGNLVGGTITTTYANGTSGVDATITVATSSNWTAITIDGQSLSVNDRVLIKDQAANLQNGIYFVTQVGEVGNTTSFIFKRALDNDQSLEIDAGDLTYVIAGTANGGDGYVQTTANITVGTTGVVWTQFSGAGAVPIATTSTAGIASFSSSNFAVNGSGEVTLTAVAYSALPTNVGVVARKVSLVGTGSGTTIALTHGLGTNLVTAQVYDTSTSTATLVETDITVTSTVATATFASTTTLSNYTLVVIG